MHALISYASHNQTCYFIQEIIVLFAVFYFPNENKNQQTLSFLSIFPSVFSFLWISSRMGCIGDADSISEWCVPRIPVWDGVLRHLDFIWSDFVYSIHIEFVRNITRSILGDNKAARIWCQANAQTHDDVRGISVARRCMHIFATTINTRQCSYGQAYR